MIRIFRKSAGVALAAFSLFLTACSVPMTPETLAKRGLKPGEGLIVGSFKMAAFDENGPTTEGTANSASVFGKPSKGSATVVISPKRIAYGEEEVFAIPVKEGDYELYGWSVSAIGYPSSTSYRNRLPMSVPFSVKAGEATYIGRMNAVVISGKNLFGLPALGGGLMLVTDHFQKDAAWISKDYPLVPKDKIRRSQVPKRYMDEMKRIADTPPSFWSDMFPSLKL